MWNFRNLLPLPVPVLGLVPSLARYSQTSRFGHPARCPGDTRSRLRQPRGASALKRMSVRLAPREICGLVICSLLACQPRSEQNKFVGTWSTSCESPTVISVPENGPAIMGINANQISVAVNLEKTPTGTSIRFSRPGDLGAGGTAIDWDANSSRDPIGMLLLDKPDRARLQWFGFLNTNKNVRVWQQDADFWSGGKEILLQKCP